MPRIALSNTDDWRLRFDEQDVRGYAALNEEGDRVGTVRDMMVDTEDERIDALVLEDGTEYPARDISIGDGVVYITGAYPVNTVGIRRASEYEDYGRVTRRSRSSLAG